MRSNHRYQSFNLIVLVFRLESHENSSPPPHCPTPHTHTQREYSYRKKEVRELATSKCAFLFKLVNNSYRVSLQNTSETVSFLYFSFYAVAAAAVVVVVVVVLTQCPLASVNSGSCQFDSSSLIHDKRPAVCSAGLTPPSSSLPPSLLGLFSHTWGYSHMTLARVTVKISFSPADSTSSPFSPSYFNPRGILTDSLTS